MFNNFPPTWLRLPHREDTLFSIVFLFCLVVPVAFTTFFVEGFETVKFPLFLFLIGVGILLAIRRKTFFYGTGALVLLGLFWLVNLISTNYSLDVINSVIGLYGRYPGSLIFITGWVLLVPLLWNATRNDESRRLTLLRVILFQGLAISVLGILQQFNIGYYGGVTEQIRPIIPSFIGNQNFYAMYLLGTVAAAGVLWQQAQGKAASYYYLISGAIAIFAIVLSGSRGGMLGLAVTCGVYLAVALWRKYPRSQVAVMAGAIILSGLLYAGFHTSLRADTLGGTVVAAEYTTQSRYIIWSDSLKLISEHPWVGTGHGNFLTAFQSLANTALAGNERFDDAHNIFLHLAVTIGLPGLALFCLLIGFAFYQGWEQTKNQELSSLWAISAMAGALVAACFNPVSLSTWVLLAIAIAFCFGQHRVERVIPKRAKIILGFVAGLLIIVAVCFIASEIFSVIGKRAYLANDNEKTKQDMILATTLNPTNSSASVYLIGSKINLKEDSDEIDKNIQSLVEQHPRAAGLHKTSADLYHRLYKSTSDQQYRDRMNESLEKAAALEPNSAPIYGAAAYLQYKSGQTDLAMQTLNKLLSLPRNEQYPYSWLLRAEIYLNKGDKEQAIYALEKAYGQMSGQLLIKKFLEEVKRNDGSNLQNLHVPVYFPEIDI